ncbi:hypothetical protein Cabys_562 [Caldithrix abyssi DSM 13497]|uniref:Uncharacterized protein n=1 Tax=Caldithrix abyssi DSM 13497 TaxID=880073 RepID=A0A1J1C4U6_CALAY|nr:hypothetical protein Cabys_562 [Caldithrix abyssi DSM 13497]
MHEGKVRGFYLFALSITYAGQPKHKKEFSPKNKGTKNAFEHLGYNGAGLF